MRIVGGETLDVSSSGRDEDPFPTQRIGLDRGVCDTTSGGAVALRAGYLLGEATQHRIQAAGTSI